MRAVLTVIGQDKTGIIYNVSKILSESNANIEDISQTIMQGIFTMIMLVDVSDINCDFSELTEAMDNLGKSIGMSIRIQHEDIFNAMHSI
ncbi:MAG: ACT domain-containing protein [Eubacteriaceae bacterium]|nr:ACT domain-containing protein [Eubacteriaceae bacterium]MBR0384411.1 ACT domain-containing protein [Eubacteriaceae bacterium]